jgi:hypothetical protein
VSPDKFGVFDMPGVNNRIKQTDQGNSVFNDLSLAALFAFFKVRGFSSTAADTGHCIII